MNRSLSLIVGSSLLLAGGCKKAEIAPKGLEEASIFLFQEFENSDEDVQLEFNAAILDILAEAAGADMDAKAIDRAYELKIQKDFGDKDIPNGVSADAQVNRGLFGYSSHSVDDARPMHLDSNQICIESSSTLWAGRKFISGDDCWEDACERLETETAVYKKNLLAEVWYDQFKTYRTVTVEDDEGETFDVVVARAWIEESFPAEGGGGNSWDQLFQLDISIPNPDKPGETYRWFAMWSSITLGGLSDTAYGNLVVEGIDEAYVYADEYIENKIGETCKNDRDMAKPDRG